jgi:uncharacterized RDD family membrane protein YckC
MDQVNEQQTPTPIIPTANPIITSVSQMPTINQQPSSIPNVEITTASRKRRFVNYLIDRTLSFLLAYVGLLIVYILWRLLHLPFTSSTIWIQCICFFIPLVFLYYFIGERYLGRTLGKYITATQVIDKQNFPIKSKQIIIRTIARLVPFDELAILGYDRTTLHDKFSNTRVVPSHLLPTNQQPRWNKTLKIVTILLILLLPGYEGYQTVTGGERFDLPSQMPEKMKLTSFKTVSNDKADYYVMTYTGNTQSLQITRLIAGYNFDPSQICGYTIPTAGDLISSPISKDLTCTKIATSKTTYVYQVTSMSTDPSIQQITPDYYFDIPPYRYMIKATKGTITRDEIMQMLNNLTEVTQQQLQEETGANQSN